MNPWFLTQVLREEPDSGGPVMSEWGAVVDRVASFAAGCDLQMPPNGTDHRIMVAVAPGYPVPETVGVVEARRARLSLLRGRAVR